MTIKFLSSFFFCISFFWVGAQNAELNGSLLDVDGNPISFVNIALFNVPDSTLAKVETSDEAGAFTFKGMKPGIYYLEASFVGLSKLQVADISLIENQVRELGALTMTSDAIELETAVVTARRAMVEVKPDRTVFNVEGTINSAGDNGFGLLRKAPGVLVDNNNNISVLSRSGVLIYIDGKRLPLQGDALTSYLQNIPAEQIDRIDIITNPGAKYEAEGNAGIIDIRLKRDKSIGSNGNVSYNASQGRYFNTNGSFSGNYRNKKLNAFGTLGAGGGDSFNTIDFLNFQNGLLIDEINFTRNTNRNANFRFGTDFFLNDNSTIGFLVTGNRNDQSAESRNKSFISQGLNTPVDSVLRANNISSGLNNNATFNLNYAWSTGKKTLNIDADYGSYDNSTDFFQPNLYFDPVNDELISQNITSYYTPVLIDIATLKLDYELPLFGGQFGTGAKFSNVRTDNTFDFFNEINGEDVLNIQRSNNFTYSENVYAAYISYNRKLTDKLSLASGLRTEITDAVGILTPLDPSLQEPPVEQDYFTWFPNVGLTYQLSRFQTLSVSYGKRINRPDYNVLNPFRIQLSELSFSRGNAFLIPEIVHNAEVGYTLFYRFNFKLAYSRTLNQITRLIGPDESDPRAGFISWENLATQDVYSFNASLPFQLTPWWTLFVNASASHINNQADYGENGVVDVQAFTYSFFQQQTFNLPKKFVGEISGYYSGPGVWGGVFLYDAQWALNLGIQKKFLNDQFNVKLSANDIFFTSGWTGTSAFNGLTSEGSGNWDSRRVSLALNYNFGNSNVKSRKRNTGLEAESKRVGN